MAFEMFRSPSAREAHRLQRQAARQQSNRPRIPHKPVLRPFHRNARNPQIWFGYIHCRDQMIADDRSRPLSSRHCILGKDQSLGVYSLAALPAINLAKERLVVEYPIRLTLHKVTKLSIAAALVERAALGRFLVSPPLHMGRIVPPMRS